MFNDLINNFEHSIGAVKCLLLVKFVGSIFEFVEYIIKVDSNATILVYSDLTLCSNIHYKQY